MRSTQPWNGIVTARIRNAIRIVTSGHFFRRDLVNGREELSGVGFGEFIGFHIAFDQSRNGRPKDRFQQSNEHKIAKPGFDKE